MFRDKNQQESLIYIISSNCVGQDQRRNETIDQASSKVSMVYTVVHSNSYT